MPTDEFYHHRSHDLTERIRRLEDWAATYAGRATNDPAVTQGSSSGTRVSGGAGSGASGSTGSLYQVPGPFGVGGAASDAEFEVFGDALIAGGMTAYNYSEAAVLTATNYTLTEDDGTVYADASGGALTLTLPSAVGHKRTYTVKKIDTTTNAVCVVPLVGSQTIDLVSLVILAQPQMALAFRSDGANYWIVGSFVPEPVVVTDSGFTSLLAFWMGGAGSA